jgi:glycine betaine/proline transport system substrate-binding protein
MTLWRRPAFVRSVFCLAFAFVVASGVAGCGFAGGSEERRLTLGYIEWTENIANSTLIEVLAEDELGYEVELELTDLRSVLQGVSDGEYDAFLDAWMPAHQTVIDEVGGGVEVSNEPWYLNETQYGLAVPDYMDVKSIADLDDAGVNTITGIDPGALLMERINDRVIPEYDLELVLVESSTPAMLAELERAYARKEPIVFLGWSPHWMNVRYEFHYLDDPKNITNDLTEGSRLHSVYRVDLEEDDPMAYALLDSMRLNEEQVAELELEIVEAGDPKEGVRLWLEDNRDVVEPWLDAARAAESD